MANSPERTELAQRVRTKIDEFSNFDENYVSRKAELGKYNFEPLIPIMSEIRVLLFEAKEMTLEEFPKENLKAIDGIIGQLQTSIRKTQEFQVEGSDVEGRHQGLLQNLENELDKVESTLLLHLGTMKAKASSLPTHQLIQDSISTAIDSEISKQRLNLDQINSYAQRAKEAAEQAETVFRKAGTLVYATKFQDVASEHKRNATLSLIAMFISAIGFVIAFAISSHQASDKVEAQTASLTGTMLIELLPRLPVPLGFLFAALVFSKLFASERHNYVVNKHRQVSISTFELFAASTQDTAALSEMLKMAAVAAFSHQPSGYSRAPVESHPTSINLQGVAKGLDGS